MKKRVLRIYKLRSLHLRKPIRINNLQLKIHAPASVKKREMMKKVFQMKNMLTARENYKLVRDNSKVNFH